MPGERSSASIREGGPLAVAQTRRSERAGQVFSSEEVAAGEEETSRAKELSQVYREKITKTKAEQAKDLQKQIDVLNNRIYDRDIPDDGPLTKEQKAALTKEVAALGKRLRELTGSK